MGLARDYGYLFLSLLPSGRAWDRNPGSNLAALADGIGARLSLVDDRAREVLEELDPRTTSELLADWERVLGLPDPCSATANTIAERRAQVLQRLRNVGGQTPAGLIALAAELGYTVTLDEHAGVENACGRAVCGEAEAGGNRWAHTFTIHGPETTLVPTVCGAAACGDPCGGDWGNELLECAINNAKPGHTTARFVYDL